MMLKWNFLGFIFLIFLNSSVFADQEYPYKYQPLKINKKVAVFIRSAAKKDYFNEAKLMNLMRQAQYIPEVIQRITFPFETKPWNYYHDYFVNPERVQEGVKYWDEHAKILAMVQKRYGVPANVIVAIIGVESRYGVGIGHYQELGALATLAFYYQARARFFRNELLQYFLLTRQMHLSPLALMGSYAGALGIPQFMPSSYRRYAVSFNREKEIDLLHNNANAIASVANYLRKAGWRPGQPIAEEVSFVNKVPERLITDKGRPTATLGELIKYGAKPAMHYDDKLKVSLIALLNQHSEEYWLGFKNFSAIMHYNPSINYAMAVFQLSVAIRKIHEQNIIKTSTTTAATR